MRGKRSKAYRKLMSQYNITFGFREPYQVIVDAEVVKNATKSKMDLAGGLQRTLHGQVKPMITQCSIRHLYALSTAEHSYKDQAIDIAKRFERRRCNHHNLEEPLSEKECIGSVVAHNGENKHRYCVATQTPEIRQLLRAVPGVPLIYINRSVMIMESMAPISAVKREREEMVKFRLGIKDTRPKPANAAKRKRVEGGEGEGEGEEEEGGDNGGEEKKKKKRKGPKGPNPLSMKKKKKKPEGLKAKSGESTGATRPPRKGGAGGNGEAEGDGERGSQAKKKRKRKHRKNNTGNDGGEDAGGSTTIEVDS